jgi:hypothetical protein
VSKQLEIIFCFSFRNDNVGSFCQFLGEAEQTFINDCSKRKKIAFSQFQSLGSLSNIKSAKSALYFFYRGKMKVGSKKVPKKEFNKPAKDSILLKTKTSGMSSRK